MNIILWGLFGKRLWWIPTAVHMGYVCKWMIYPRQPQVYWGKMMINHGFFGLRCPGGLPEMKQRVRPSNLAGFPEKNQTQPYFQPTIITPRPKHSSELPPQWGSPKAVPDPVDRAFHCQVSHNWKALVKLVFFLFGPETCLKIDAFTEHGWTWSISNLLQCPLTPSHPCLCHGILPDWYLEPYFLPGNAANLSSQTAAVAFLCIYLRLPGCLSDHMWCDPV